MAKYRKKSVVIAATQWTEERSETWPNGRFPICRDKEGYFVEGIEGQRIDVAFGDWVVSFLFKQPRDTAGDTIILDIEKRLKKENDHATDITKTD